ncbi:hypothetical protein C8R43DRAFT_1186642, partial [Mycena crocata]
LFPRTCLELTRTGLSALFKNPFNSALATLACSTTALSCTQQMPPRRSTRVPRTQETPVHSPAVVRVLERGAFGAADTYLMTRTLCMPPRSAESVVARGVCVCTGGGVSVFGLRPPRSTAWYVTFPKYGFSKMRAWGRIRKGGVLSAGGAFSCVPPASFVHTSGAGSPAYLSKYLSGTQDDAARLLSCIGARSLPLPRYSSRPRIFGCGHPLPMIRAFLPAANLNFYRRYFSVPCIRHLCLTRLFQRRPKAARESLLVLQTSSVQSDTFTFSSPCPLRLFATWHWLNAETTWLRGGFSAQSLSLNPLCVQLRYTSTLNPRTVINSRVASDP